ncbi:hypothetical protein ABZ769_28220 [Streptomyces olivoreticuli]
MRELRRRGMTDGEIGGGPEPKPVVSQPLPPEVPAPGAEAGEAGPAPEWWRLPAAPLPPEAPSPTAEPSPGPGPDGPREATNGGAEPGDGAPGSEWWQGSAVRDELRDTWAVHGSEGIAAAHEIGAHIGEAISARLPDPQAAAAKRGLDIRWMRLKYNVPAILIALLVTWGGRSAVDRMSASVSEKGVFAPLGWVLMAGLILGVLMLLPIGSWLGAALADLFASVLHGVVRLFGRAWKTPYTGYLLRLVAAVAAWSFAIAVGRLIGRAAINFLTGA